MRFLHSIKGFSKRGKIALVFDIAVEPQNRGDLLPDMRNAFLHLTNFCTSLTDFAFPVSFAPGKSSSVLYKRENKEQRETNRFASKAM
jgi:hypothetical protein